MQLIRLALLFLAALITAAAQDGFYLRNNDTVVFYGDSITDQRLYTTFVETFVATRYPQLNVRFVHSGWGGDRVTGGGGGPVDERLRRDVIAYKPTVMTVMLGMNDGRYRAFEEAIFEEYKTGMEHIVQVTKAALPDLRVTLIQPSPYDDVTREPTFPGGYNAVLVRYGQFVKDLAYRHQMLAADLNTSVVEALKKANTASPADAQAIIRDRIHPASGGHLLMAQSLLKAWGASPIVSAVEIDAAAKEVKKSEKTTITGLTVDKTVTWSETDAALPMPVNMRDPAMPAAIRQSAPTVDLALKSSDFMEAMNQQTLRVRGLEAASYALRINGKPVGSFNRDQLDKGINLAGLATPMAKQAADVHQLTLRRTDVHQLRWRQLQVPFKDDNLPRVSSIIDNLDALDDDLAMRQRAAARPAACFYELIPE